MSWSPAVGESIEVLLFSQCKYHHFLNCWVWWNNLGRKHEYELLPSKSKFAYNFFFLLSFLIGLTYLLHDYELTDLLFTYISWIAIISFFFGTLYCYTLRIAASLRIFLFQNYLVLLYSNAMFQLKSR